MDVSIVVLAWEDIDRTAQCVRSLPTAAEIIVVDNGSSAPIRDAVEALCGEVGAQYVQSGENLGYARGMNLGARHATRTNIILANNDVIVHSDSVDRLLAALDAPDVGAAFPQVVNPDGSDETAGGRFLTPGLGIAHAVGLNLLVPRLRITAEPAVADWLTGPFVVMRRRDFEAIGGVDETSYFYSEDLRLCWAVQRKLGMRIAYITDATINHLGDASSQRRWSSAEIAQRQTREFVRAARQLGGGGSGRIAATAYTLGALWRGLLGRDAVRRGIGRGALEGLRSR
ncbi:glycosyl transferase [Longispora fulva]|uniref:GT2 family glycosyltransferase n=1 Tax=Longispora fulva TaxID=619741 RepID=A0A8J7GHR5_9ACTN|nr:glycosyltransferase family 2 protein [Longispora fulva]MBG6137740.1 GT2 family glycosyltransferase [Longispora fulva]GIG62104.1 glycosyl transferase [Longispora fulva]